MFTDYLQSLIEKFTGGDTTTPTTVIQDRQRRRDEIMGLGARKPTKVKLPEEDLLTQNERLWTSLRAENDRKLGEKTKLQKELESVGLTPPKENFTAVGYGKGVTQEKIELMISNEAKLRGIDTNAAIKIFRSEGLGSYQSKLKYKGKRERSYGPFQLFVDGGLGNEYEKETGGTLSEENNLEGVRRQIQWSLDYVAKTGTWKPWKGIKFTDMEFDEGLNGAIPVGNWRTE